MKKTILTFLLLVIMPFSMLAYDVYVGKLYYNVDESTGTAEVTFKSNSYNSYTGKVVIPATFYDPDSHVTYTVTSIGDNAFRSCSNLTSVTIPEGVTRIGEWAFYNCKSLTNITIPSGVKYIFGYTFNNCSGLTSITIPNSVTSIREYAFQNCTSLTTLTIGTGVTSIGESTFRGCTNLTSVTFPNSVRSIGNGAFSGCTSLTSVVFSKNTSLSRLTEIGQNVFNSCTSLTEITLPNNNTTIGFGAFWGCSSLESVFIPSRVKSIDHGSFSLCSNLSTITVSPDNSWYDSRDNCNAIIEKNSNTLVVGCKSTVIPEGVTSIGDDAFNGSGLTSIIIPNTVTNIGNSAFGECTNLTSIIIPSSITSIEDWGFAGCSRLTSVTVEWSYPQTIASNTFTNRANATLYVPSGAVSYYQSYDYWKDFKYIVADRRQEQSIDLNELPILTYGGEDYTLPEKTAQNLPITWTTSNNTVASVSGTTLSIKKPGKAYVTAKQGGNAEYQPFKKTYTLTVDKAPLTIKANNCERGEGDENPEFTFTYEGFVNGDDVSCLTSMPVATTTATTTSSPGTYRITVSGASAANYDISYQNGVLTVKQKETYAYLNGRTLTFCHDIYKSSHSNTYSLSNGSSTPAWITPNNQENITKVVFDSSFDAARPLSCYGWFFNFTNLTNISGLEYLNTSEVTNMHGMFANCSRLQLLDVSHFDTGNVTDMGEIFEGCSSLLSLDVSGFSTSNVTSMYAMFDGCSNLGALDVSGFNTDKVTSMDNMFNGCGKLTSLDLGGFDASKTSKVYNFLTNCSHLTSLTLSSSMAKMADSACSGVGTSSSPCLLYVPADFDFGGVDTSGSCFQWKGGFFQANFTSVVVTAKDYTIQYGDAIPTLEYTAQGAPLRGTPTLSCSATSSSPVGTYTITVSKGSITNTNATLINGTLTIEKAPLIITAKSYTITQGNALPTFEATYSGFKNNETASVLTTQPSFSCSATSSSAPGAYTITPSGAAAANYTFTYVNGTLTIMGNQTVNLTQIPAQTYGATTYNLPEKTNAGLTITWSSSNTNVATVSGHTLTIKNAGTATITATQAGNSNYNSFSKTYTLTVNKAPLTVTAKSYTITQGDALPTFEATYSGFKNNETASVLTTQPSFSCTATSSSAPGAYTISPSGAAAANYSFTYVNGTLTIEAPPSPAITFANTTVKALCVQNWDTNGDGELSEAEAAAVTDLGAVFRQNKNITSFDELQYFTGLTSIADSAFYACSYMASVTIPSSVTAIGNNAFLVCNGLTSVTIPKSVTSIGNGVFSSCSKLTSIIVENGSSSYSAENGVLFNKNKTTILCYPAGKTQSTYTIPSSVTSIGRSAFNGCSKLTSVTIPNSVTSIGYGAFYGSSGLTSVTIPNSVTDIGQHAFNGCSKLTSVTIPNSVTSIGNYAFNGCSKLTSVDIPNSVTTLGYYAFFQCYDLTSVTIGNSVKRIGLSTFRYCNSLKSITIPNSVTKIDQEAFKGCTSLTSVAIPESVTSLGTQAFKDCSALTSVKVGMESPLTIDSETFTNRANATLYVPKGSKGAYQADNYWKVFKAIKEFPDTDVNQDGEIDMVDVVDIARFVVGTPADTFVVFLADLNSDDEVNVADAVVLVNEIVGDQNFAAPQGTPRRALSDDRLMLTENDDHSLSLSMESERDYTAFQFDLYTNSEDDLMSIRLNNARKHGHQLIYNKVDDGHYRVVALSVANNTFYDNSGELLNIQIDGFNTADMTISNIHFITTDGTDHRFDDLSLSSVTGIESIAPNSSAKGDGNIYDLNGRKVSVSSDSSVLPKGVYIMNGRKVVVK